MRGAPLPWREAPRDVNAIRGGGVVEEAFQVGLHMLPMGLPAWQLGAAWGGFFV